MLQLKQGQRQASNLCLTPLWGLTGRIKGPALKRRASLQASISAGGMTRIPCALTSSRLVSSSQSNLLASDHPLVCVLIHMPLLCQVLRPLHRGPNDYGACACRCLATVRKLLSFTRKPFTPQNLQQLALARLAVRC